MVLGTKLEGKLLDLLAVAKVSATMFAFSLSSVTTPLSEVRFRKDIARKFPDRDLAALHIFFVLARVVRDAQNSSQQLRLVCIMMRRHSDRSLLYSMI